jgi:hypothetical protein
LIVLEICRQIVSFPLQAIRMGDYVSRQPDPPIDHLFDLLPLVLGQLVDRVTSGIDPTLERSLFGFDPVHQFLVVQHETVCSGDQTTIEIRMTSIKL